MVACGMTTNASADTARSVDAEGHSADVRLSRALYTPAREEKPNTIGRR
jgi:hypothetical protein